MSWDSVDFGAPPRGVGSAASAGGDRGEVGQLRRGRRLASRASSPGGSSRGTQSEYSFAQVPSAITASSPELRASISGWFSLATA